MEVINEIKKHMSVSFDPIVKIHNMHVWKFGYREARKGNLMQIVADRARFQRRMQLLEAQLIRDDYFSQHQFRVDQPPI